MISLKSYILLEYLTDAQRAKFSKIEMSPKARADTDSFFGKGNDAVKEEIKNYDHDKSEIHRKVEKHLGVNISPEEYKSGIVKDKYNRPSKLGRMIKDEKLRNDFASDNSRALSKKQTRPYISVVRGTEVAGQTNPEPNAEHPKGHSWADESCKNIEDGCNNGFLKDEIKHGTVVVRAHDADNKEIYRGTLQPYHNDKGHVMYKLNGEYGIKHPSFTAHANDVANRLSGEYKPGVFKIHPKVYDDLDSPLSLHPKATPEHISKALDDTDSKVRLAAIQHPNLTAEHITKALNDKSSRIRSVAILHPKATPEHISKALNDRSEDVRINAASNPNITPEHITKALNDKNASVRIQAIEQPKATPEHISKALNDEHPVVRLTAARSPNATPEHISKALDDERDSVREAAITNPNATHENITKALSNEDDFIRKKAIQHPNATPEHIAKALKDKSPYVRDFAKNLKNNISNLKLNIR